MIRSVFSKLYRVLVYLLLLSEICNVANIKRSNHTSNVSLHYLVKQHYQLLNTNNQWLNGHSG